MKLRNRIIRLAHSKPELRSHLLPLLKLSGRGGPWRDRGDTIGAAIIKASDTFLTAIYAQVKYDLEAAGWAGVTRLPSSAGNELEITVLGRNFGGKDSDKVHIVLEVDIRGWVLHFEVEASIDDHKVEESSQISLDNLYADAVAKRIKNIWGARK